ncbi:MAG: ABC transporter permease [Cyclobacteriaceae bacterium]|nr:MAG: ABC transporter permease [Cyclobacteriaceae bacterium]
MLKNYLKSALRNLWRYKGHSAINILGLAIGMACLILIMLYVKSELSYDKFHQHKDQLYLLNIQTTNPQTGDQVKRVIGPYRLADELAVDFPDFEQIIRIAPRGGESVEIADQIYIEERLAFVDPGVFQTFTFPLIQGNPQTALDDPYSVVITPKTAQKYFGEVNALGKTVRIRDFDFAVTGIMEEIPEQSQFRCDILVSMNCAPQAFSRIVRENWGEGYVWTVVKVPEGKDAEDFLPRLAEFTDTKLKDWADFSPVINMHPLTDVYLDSKDFEGFQAGGDRTYVIAFSFIALFILLIACINFINLATARSSLRAKEVGLRKVVGAERSQIIGQFLSESTILAVICLVLAVILAKICLPYFSELADRDITWPIFKDLPMLLVMLVVTLFVGLAAGSYPALLISGFKPVNILSGKLKMGFKGAGLRKMLVTFQFATSILLLIITSVVYQQLDYCRSMNLGFDKEHLVRLGGTSLSMREKYDQFQNELLTNSNIVNAAASSRVPPGSLSSNLGTRPEGIPEDQQRGMQTVWTDYDFLETMGFELAAGRSFSRDFPSDASNAFIINEAAVREIGWTNESAIDKTFGSSEITDWDAGQWVPRDGKVIGVLKDFHFESLKEEIVPTVYFIAPYMAWNYVVRITPEQTAETIQFIEDKWKQFNPEQPFEYTFVDESYDQLYKDEERQGKIFAVFASLAIFIACLGLVGMASFTAERRKKEVGIRKVLGASSSNVVLLLSREFTFLVVLALLIASPLAWIIIRNWLEGFAYQVTLGLGAFLLSGLTTLLIAWATVAYQTGKAALTNPVNSLRSE